MPNNHASTLTRGPTGARSLCIIAAVTAAASVYSVALVAQQFVSLPPAYAKAAATASTTASSWDLEPRWWPGEVQQVTMRASTAPDSDLTFAKGYASRVAARQQAAAAAQLAANEAPAESPSARPAITVHKTATPARVAGAPSPHRVSAARIDAPVDQPARLDFSTRALAFGEERPSRRGFAEPQGGPFAALFGNLF